MFAILGYVVSEAEGLHWLPSSFGYGCGSYSLLGRR